MATSKNRAQEKSLPKRKPLLELQPQMQIEFLGWHRPVLHAACDYLWDHYRRGTTWNLDRMLVVLPGSLAGRRLEVLLAERALREQVVLRPPRFITLGELPEELYRAKFPFASPLTQTMAWVQVLRAMPLAELQPLLFEVPASDQLGPWMDLAKLLSSLHRELASDLVDFADVAEALQSTPEEARWRVLARLQRRYLDVLHEAGLWDIQSARRFALEHHEVSRIDHEVVLVGTVDLNRAQRQFLAAIAPHVRALVGAPKSFSEGFDADGTLRSDFWQSLEIPIAEDRIHVRTTVSDAAEELALQLALFHGKRRSDEITIGVPDIAIVPTLQETLARSSVELRYGPGTPINQSPPMRVLQALEDYLREQDIHAFTDLIRVPTVYDWLLEHVRWNPNSSSTGTPPGDVDTPNPTAPLRAESYSAESSSLAAPSATAADLPGSSAALPTAIQTGSDSDSNAPLPARFLLNIDKYLSATLLRSAFVAHFPEASGRREFVAVQEALENWLRPLRVGKQSLSQWSMPIRSVLLDLFANVRIDPSSPEGNRIARGCREINAVLEKLTNIPSNLDLPVDWNEAIAWVHEQLNAVQLPPIPNDQAIEMIGWLELALDDAPVLLLTGMHDGVIPESANSDAFLPNRLRGELGLIDNARRYARDAYVMMNLLHTRQDFHCIMNRLSTDGDPLTPSRLMMAVPADRIAGRVRMLVSEPSIAAQPVEGWPIRPAQSNVPIPPPNPNRSVTDMAVTDFKKYSECPYRFYLNRVEKVRAFDPPPLELDGGGFGDLVHHVLEGLITAPVAESTDAEALRDWLVESLEEEAARRFGSQMPPALIIQIEQAKLRFAAFAEHQAQHAREGWRIRHIEHAVQRGNGIRWELPNGIMEIHGRIDRIDVNERTGEIAVLDYKTGDTSDEPRKAHVKKDGSWIDWQLPLYGQLISTLGISDLSNVKFGYVLLPKNAQQTRFAFADFTLSEHAAAIDSAKTIAQNVLDRVYWPPNNKLPLDWDDYRWITQRTVVRKWDPARELASTPPQPTASEPIAQPENPTASSSSPESPAPATIGTEPIDSENTVTIATEWAPPSTAPTNTTTPDGRTAAADASEARRSSPTDDQPSRMTLTPVVAKGQAPEEWFFPAMILASAGTGKTYQLASRAIRLLFTDQPLDSILATTFTRKAAGEILHRVLSWLADASETEEGFERMQSILAPLSITRETVQYQLSRLCSHLHRFRVSTLDSFYAQLAKSFALELQLPPGWTLVDPNQEEQIHREAITRLFDQIEYRHLRSLISQLSKGEAVRGVRAEVEAVVTNGYELFRQAKPEAWQQLHIPTAPSTDEVDAALQALEATSMGTGQRNAAKDKARGLFVDSQWDEFLSTTLVTACLDDEPTYNRKPIEPEILTPLNVLRRHALTAALTHRRLQNEAALQILQRFDTCLADIKTARRLVTFSDVAEKLSRWMQSTVDAHRSHEAPPTADLVHGKPSPPNFDSIAHRMDCPVDHLLLDEFQDTSPVQWGIVKPFANAIAENLGNPEKASSFFCVGDSKQAIYAWRGGVSEIFESVSRQIRNVREEKLSTSRRSSPVIIDFVNDVFPRLVNHPNFIGDDDKDPTDTHHPIVSKWLQRYFVLHSTAKQQLSGYVEFRNARCDENTDQDGEKTSRQLFEEVADRVAELHAVAPYHSIGILTRTNADIASLISLLRDRGVEASQEGGNPLTDTAPILLIRSALQLANHPGDSLAHFHLLNSPLAERWDATLRQDPHGLAAEIRRKLDVLGFGGTVSFLTQTIAPACTERDQQRLQQLIGIAYRFDSFRRTQIEDFIELLDKHKAALPGDSPVRVMTIHQSKGLEFDAVFLPTLDQTIVSRNPDYIVMRADRTSEPIGIMRHMSRKLQRHLPAVWQIAFQESLEQQMGEALCLLYVAITRARQALYLITSPSSNAKKRWGSALHTLFDKDGKSDEPGAVLHFAGNPNWYAAPGETAPAVVADVPAPAQPLRPKLKLHLAPHQPDAVIQSSLAPSRLDETPLHRGAELWKPNDIAGTIIGKIVHRWFEEIDGWIEDFRPNRKHLHALAQATLTQTEMSQLKLAEWVDRFLLYCESEEIRQALSRDRYRAWDVPRVLRLDVTTERRLLQILDGRLVRGVIDRCVLGYDGDRVVRAEILDFKTDQREEREDIQTWIASRQQAHAPQLIAYRRVLCRQFALHPDQVAMTLVLLSENRIEPVLS